MPAVIPLIVAGVSAAGSVAAAKINSGASENAANLQSQSAANALKFQTGSAAQDLATANAIQQANYQQWAAKRQALNALGATVGAPPVQMPGYVPLPNSGAATQQAGNYFQNAGNALGY